MRLTGWECPRCNRIWGPLALQCLHCNDSVATVGQDATPVAERAPRDVLVQRAIVDLSAPGSALRARLQAAANDLTSAGYGAADIAARLEAGESVDV